MTQVRVERERERDEDEHARRGVFATHGGVRVIGKESAEGANAAKEGSLALGWHHAGAAASRLRRLLTMAHGDTEHAKAVGAMRGRLRDLEARLAAAGSAQPSQ